MNSNSRINVDAQQLLISPSGLYYASLWPEGRGGWKDIEEYSKLFCPKLNFSLLIILLVIESVFCSPSLGVLCLTSELVLFLGEREMKLFIDLLKPNTVSDFGLLGGFPS